MVEVEGIRNKDSPGPDNFARSMAAAVTSSTITLPHQQRNNLSPMHQMNSSDNDVDDGIEVDAGTDADADDVIVMDPDPLELDPHSPMRFVEMGPTLNLLENVPPALNRRNLLEPGPSSLNSIEPTTGPTLNLNVTHSDYTLPQCSTMGSPELRSIDIARGPVAQASCSSEPVLSNNALLFAAAYCNNNGAANTGGGNNNTVDANIDSGKNVTTCPSMANYPLYFQNYAWCYPNKLYYDNNAKNTTTPSSGNLIRKGDEENQDENEDVDEDKEDNEDDGPGRGGVGSSNLITTPMSASNVKFAHDDDNSAVDMTSNDYLTGNASNGNISSANIRDSCSAKNHHAAVQNRYSRTRRRHYTDPVDFEGILRIIGGCGWWQLWIYILISLQQIPHAMFNLSVIYMMFKPDHWCYQEWFDPVKHDKFSGWTSEQIRNITSPIVYDHVHDKHKYSECMMYDREPESYHDLSHMSFENASAVADTNLSGKSCDKWTYDNSVMEDTIVTQWNLVCGNNFHRADAQLAYALGYFIGCLVSGLSSDRFGRKPTVIGYGVLASMFGMILPYSTYFPMFLLIRFLSAVCNEAADLAAYVLCMEITGTKYRSSVGSLLQLPWAFGYTLLALVAYLTKSWRTIQIITAAVHTVTILFICVLPESPRWLIVNNRVREAEAIIRKACRMNNSHLPADLELVKHAEQRKWVKRNERANLLHLFKSYELVLRTLIIFIIWIATALVYYGISLNLSDQSAPGGKLFSGNFFVNSAVAGAVEIPTLLACCVILRYGRKRSQMVTLILAGIMMLGVVFSPGVGYLRLIFMLLGKMFIQGAFNILYIFTSELYPTVIRNSAVGTCSMVARMGAGVTGYLAILSDITLPTVPMMIFGVFSLVAGTLVVFLPETQDQPLPDTLQDAVIFLKADKYPYCNLGGLATHKFSTCDDQSALNELRNAHNAKTNNANVAQSSANQQQHSPEIT